jgi:anti-sigma regulatory factor (Ser/Thr protein kinase)
VPDEIVPVPASLQVFRYKPGRRRVDTVMGVRDSALPHADLVTQADEAMRRDTFMCYAVSQADDFVADELCFVPQGDHCEILSIHTNGWQRHHGDHRRSLVEILTTLAAAVACGRLRILDRAELAAETRRGDRVLLFDICDSASLGVARDAVAAALRETGLPADVQQRTILCLSEAVTNMLLHGGGRGRLTLRRLDELLRIVVADEGPGLNFLNWIEPPSDRGQASMGYGFKIIVDHLDGVGLHSSGTGTTLILDRKTD